MSTVFQTGILAGKTAFIAGGSSGINLGIARGLALSGAQICIISRSDQRVMSAVEELKAEGHIVIGYSADVRNYDDVLKTLQETQRYFGDIDIVVSGAAGNFLAPANTLSANGFKTVVDIDLLGTFNVFRASFDYLRKPGAALLAITAGQADRPKVDQIHACAAKAGVNMVTKCLALEWGQYGIRVNGISPGPIGDTEGMKRLAPSIEVETALKRRIPLGRYGEKSEIADLAVFLCSDAAHYITGSIMTCDGGSNL